jgi:aminotransferase
MRTMAPTRFSPGQARVRPLRAPDWTLDPDRLRRAFNARRGDHRQHAAQSNGRVLTREEMTLIAELCIEHDAWAITDSPVRAHGVRGPSSRDRHLCRACAKRTITILIVQDVQLHGLAHRLDHRAAERRRDPFRKVHDFLTVGAPAPLQPRPRSASPSTRTTTTTSATSIASSRVSLPRAE